VSSAASEDWIDPNAILYGLVLKVWEWIFNSLTELVMQKKNFQYQKDYNDGIAYQMFFFYCINSFLPLLYVAFFKQNYNTLFTMLLVMVVID
jgi:hypothetical protein